MSVLAESSQDTTWDITENFLERLKTVETNDVVYSNNPNGIDVYTTIEDSSDIVGHIPFLWGITRYRTVGEDWSVISYDYKDYYVKNTNIWTADQKPYEIKEETYDVVLASPDGTTVFSSPDENSEIIGTIPAGWGIDRILSLNNGWSVISYNCQNYFAKTSDLFKKSYIGNYTITYYCPCSICNGPYGPYDRYGNRLVDGTAAVDPSIIPMGSTFYVQESYGLRTCIARDVGGAINGAHIDVFVDVPHNVCENMGNTKKPVYMYTACE